MSVIEKLARILGKTWRQYDDTLQGHTENEYEEIASHHPAYVASAKAVLQCLSANIDAELNQLPDWRESRDLPNGMWASGYDDCRKETIEHIKSRIQSLIKE